MQKFCPYRHRTGKDCAVRFSPLIRCRGGRRVEDMDMTQSTNPESHFASIFRQATGNSSPLPYQKCLALADTFPMLLDVPTGLGKTAAVILAWVWQRRFAEEAIRTSIPRRLV